MEVTIGVVVVDVTVVVEVLAMVGEAVVTTTIGTIGSTPMGIRKKSSMQIVTIVVGMAIGLGRATNLVGFAMILPTMSRSVLGTLGCNPTNLMVPVGTRGEGVIIGLNPVLMLHKHIHRGTSTMHSMVKRPRMMSKTLHPPLMWLMGWMVKFLPALDFVGRRHTMVRP